MALTIKPEKLLINHEWVEAQNGKRFDAAIGSDSISSSYRQLFRAPLSKTNIEAIRESTNKAWALGNARFQAKIKALAGRRAAPMPKARPVKND